MPRSATDDTPERIEVDGSLFHALLAQSPGLEPVSVTKGVLVVASHLIEELAAGTGEPSVLLSGFQHTRHWQAERDRYLRLSDETDVIAVFAGRTAPADWETRHIGIRLRTGNPLEQEWFVLAVGPTLAITLCGLDGGAHAAAPPGPGGPAEESDRLFDVVWSLDPEVARAASDVVVAAIERDAPDRAADVRERLARARPAPTVADVARTADLTTAGMLRRLEHLRAREHAADLRASAAKSEFLSRMSHELRTPLNAVLGFTQLLEAAELSAEDSDNLAQIRRAGRHLLTLVDDVLDVSSIESGVLPVQLGTFAVAGAVEEAVSLVAVTAAGSNATLDLDPTCDPTQLVRADRRYVVQILVNLLANAVKFSADGGPVVVSWHADGHHVFVDVRDSGAGIAAADLAEIFMPFARLETSGEPTEGSGLGLSISRAMAIAAGGRIDVASTPGVGSTFTLVLPEPEASPQAG